MKITRSSVCSLKFLNKRKSDILNTIIEEYSKAVNYYITILSDTSLKQGQFIDTFTINSFEHDWMTHRLKKNACREAVGMLVGYQTKKKSNNRVKIPRHYGKKMIITSTCFTFGEKSAEFDWLHLYSNGLEIVDIPYKRHKHFNKLLSRGKLNNTITISKEKIQFSFEIETGKKKDIKTLVGVDSGINALASCTNGKQYGTDIKECINRIKRCKYGSKGQQKARRALKQRLDEVSKELVSLGDLLVIENLLNITKNVKRRLTKNIRRSIGSWNIRYFHNRLKMDCENKNVSYRTVAPFYTSIKCPVCGFTDRTNRSLERFKCGCCGHTANADLNAALNILERFVTGMYGSCYQSLFDKTSILKIT